MKQTQTLQLKFHKILFCIPRENSLLSQKPNCAESRKPSRAVQFQFNMGKEDQSCLKEETCDIRHGVLVRIAEPQESN